MILITGTTDRSHSVNLSIKLISTDVNKVLETRGQVLDPQGQGHEIRTVTNIPVNFCSTQYVA